MHELYAMIHFLPWLIGIMGTICLVCIVVGEAVAEIQWNKALANELLDEVLKLHNKIKELERQPQHVKSISDLTGVDLEREPVEVIVDPSPIAELDGWITVHPKFDRKLKELDEWLDKPIVEQEPPKVEIVPPDELVDLDTWQGEEFDIDIVEEAKAEGKMPEAEELNFNPPVEKTKKKRRRRKRNKKQNQARA